MDHAHVISRYMEHGECFLWEPGLVWLHVVSDIVTGIAYFSIPFGMFYFAYRRRDLPFHSLFLLFGAFILACGTTHLFAAYTVFVPEYWVEGGVKALTAIVSAASAVYFIPRIPKAIALPSLRESLDENRKLNAQLEKRLEELERQKSLMNAVIGGTSDAIFVKDTAGRYLMANEEVTRVFGKPLEEILGRDDTHFFPLDEAHHLIWGDREIMSMSGPVTREEHVTTVHGRRAYMATKGPVRDGQGNVIGLFGISRDITESRNMADQLRQAQKMEAVGRLAGGIAHDFNNLLTVINGYSEILIGRVDGNSPLSREVEEIRRAGERAAALTRQLLAFSRRQVLQPKVLDLNEVVSHMEKMLRRLIGEDIELRTVLGTGLGSVRADPGQIEQVLVNLAVNSRDAMPEGGTLTVETAKVILDEEFARNHPSAIVGPHVSLAVRDNGTGMSDAAKAHLFEPFFTTKEKGKGTGLGLSTVYGIVNQSRGHITVDSEAGVGTVVTMYLPCVDDKAEKLAEGPFVDVRGRETVLVVEDEDSVREITGRVLREKGYRVLLAGNGDEGLRAFGDPGESIDLLITDVVMPGMTGRALAKRVAAAKPGIRVLFMSGYTDEAIDHHGVLEEGLSYLQKPFSANALLAKVREVLDAGRT